MKDLFYRVGTMIPALVLCSGVMFPDPIFAGPDSTSFIPVDVRVIDTSIPIGTVITWPASSYPAGWDKGKWLECNGQSTSGYPELAKVIGARTPNYANQFLRGGTVAQVGQTAADSVRSHSHAVPEHSHTVSGKASAQKVNVGPQKVTGTASGQYLDYHQEVGTGEGYRNDGGHAFMDGVNITSTTTNADHYHGIYYNGSWSKIYGHNRTGTVNSNVDGSTAGGVYYSDGGTVEGYTNSVKMTTENTGSSETAPQHARVRYFIRAKL